MEDRPEVLEAREAVHEAENRLQAALAQLPLCAGADRADLLAITNSLAADLSEDKKVLRDLLAAPADENAADLPGFSTSSYWLSWFGIGRLVGTRLRKVRTSQSSPATSPRSLSRSAAGCGAGSESNAFESKHSHQNGHEDKVVGTKTMGQLLPPTKSPTSGTTVSRRRHYAAGRIVAP